MSERRKGIAFVLAAAMLWGTMGTAQALAPAGYDPRVIGALRLLVGGGALFAVSARRGEFTPWRAWHWASVAFCALALAEASEPDASADAEEAAGWLEQPARNTPRSTATNTIAMYLVVLLMPSPFIDPAKHYMQ